MFTDVLCNSSLDKDYKLSNFANLKIALVAFESDKIPPSWVEIINKNFDLILVNALFLEKALKNSGVEKDIIYLPLALDYSDLEGIPLKKDQYNLPVKYGFIGSYEKRKNIELLVDSFNAAFKGTNVELHIHLSYNFCYDLSKFNMFLNKIMSNQIKVTSGHLDRKDYVRLIKSIDCFISLSMGEGFSIVPREFMYLNKPIVLSHSAAHKDIPNLNGIFHIPATISFPAYYHQIDKKYYGLQYSPYIDDVVNLWSKIHEEIKKKKVYPELKGYAQSFSIESLAKKYEQIFNPQKITLGNTSCVEDDCLKITSKNLLNKYKEIIPDLKVEKINNISKHIVLAHDGGFFSVFNRFISILAWENKRLSI